MGTALVEARGVSLGYGRHVVLEAVDLRIEAGQRWFLLGPNGHGKTTLLRGLLGLLAPRAGELWRDPQQMAPPRVGFVPQRCDFSPSLPTTTWEFVDLGLVGVDVRRADRRARVSAALSRVELTELAERDYWSLSGGQRQRALLGRALVREPRVLLLDEPTAGLDINIEDLLMRLLVRQNERSGLTIVFVSHRVELAARYATHMALVAKGGVRAGPVAEVLAEEHLRQAYDISIRVYRDARGGAAVSVGGEVPV